LDFYHVLVGNSYHIFQLFLRESLVQDSFIKFELAFWSIQEGILGTAESENFLGKAIFVQSHISRFQSHNFQILILRSSRALKSKAVFAFILTHKNIMVIIK